MKKWSIDLTYMSDYKISNKIFLGTYSLSMKIPRYKHGL